YAAIAPYLRDLRQIEVEFFLLLHDGETLGEGLHHAILDAVVHHLDEVARTRRAHVTPALVLARRKRFEAGAQIFDGFLVAADHHAVSLFQSPHPAGGAHIHKLIPFG